jgi:hypothetical protein
MYRSLVLCVPTPPAPAHGELSPCRSSCWSGSATQDWHSPSALIAAWLLLGEWLSSVWQIVGAVLVMAAVTAFLAYQAFHQEPNLRVS